MDWGFEFRGIPSFEGTFGVIESTKLNRDTGADSNEGCESSLVESGRAFVFQDRRGGIQCSFILGCGLETDFDNVCAWSEENFWEALHVNLTEWLTWDKSD